MKLKKQSHEFLPDGKLKVWVEVEAVSDEEKKDKWKIPDFTVTVSADTSKEDLDKAIKEEFKKLKAQNEKLKELGIGEEVK